MKCNIDARGKFVRLIWGGLMFLCAIAAAALTYFGVLPTIAGWIGTVILFALGVVGVIEARKGWCVVRGMGFKTPV